jgi:hypothetical protein
VGPFHARIFQAAVETGVPVQPVALVYGVKGDAQTIVAFGPGESFFANSCACSVSRRGVRKCTSWHRSVRRTWKAVGASRRLRARASWRP